MTQLAFDKFQRADANPIGGNWTTLSNTGDIQLASQQAQASLLASECEAFYNAAVWPNDQYSEITLGVTTSQYIHVGVRYGGAGNGYILLVECTSGNVYIQKLAGGSGSTLIGPVSSGLPFSSGEIVRLTVQGTLLSATRNGIPATSVTDSDIASGSAGFGFFVFGAIAGATVASWSGGNLLTPPSGVDNSLMMLGCGT